MGPTTRSFTLDIRLEFAVYSLHNLHFICVRIDEVLIASLQGATDAGS
jgi:hypothetical protein